MYEGMCVCIQGCQLACVGTFLMMSLDEIGRPGVPRNQIMCTLLLPDTGHCPPADLHISKSLSVAKIGPNSGKSCPQRNFLVVLQHVYVTLSKRTYT